MKRLFTLTAGLVLAGASPLLGDGAITGASFPSLLQVYQTANYSITTNVVTTTGMNPVTQCGVVSVHLNGFTSGPASFTISDPTPATPSNGSCTYTGTMSAGADGGTVSFVASFSYWVSANQTYFPSAQSFGTITVYGVGSVTVTPGAASIGIGGAFAKGTFTATVLDDEGTPTPIPNIPVTFATSTAGNNTTTAGGTFVTTGATADNNGKATSDVLNVTKAPGTFNVTATANGLASSPTTVTVLGVGTVTLTATSTTAASGGSLGAGNFSAKVLATDGTTLLSGVPVVFSTSAAGSTTVAGGSFSTTTETSGSNGVAQSDVLNVAKGPGTFTVLATANGVMSSPVTVTVTPGVGSITIAPLNATVTANGTLAAGTFMATVYDNETPPVLMNGQTVTFASGGGTFSPTSASTALGIASSPTFTAGKTAGTNFTVTASTGGQMATSALTITAGSPSAIAISAGNTQSASAGAAFTTPLAVSVTDSVGNPVNSGAVTFTAPSGGATGVFSAANGVTLGNGGASATVNVANGVATAPAFTASSVTGSFMVTAALNGTTATTTFNLSVAGGVAASIVLSAGSPQSTVVGSAFGTNLQVSLLDKFGNVAGSGTVTFTVPTTGATGTFASSGATATVNAANGLATAPKLTAGTTAGAFTAMASLNAGNSVVSFSLAVTSGTASSLSVTAGNAQSTPVNMAFTTLLSVTVLDNNNPANPVPYASVTFTTPAQTGASALFNGATSQVVVANASGVATVTGPFTANSIAGAYMVTATLTGTGITTSFNLTNAAGAPATVTVTGGGQSTVINGTFTNLITATVLDAAKNPVPGATVSFSVANVNGGATATFNNNGTQAATITATTNASGVATATSLTAGSAIGQINVSATVVSSTVTGTVATPLTITPGPAAKMTVNAGSGQSAAVGTAFSNALSVKIVDAGGNAVTDGFSVTFTTATVSNNANGTFAGTNTNTYTTTTKSGIATASTLTANSTGVGAFTVTATTTSPALTVTFTESTTSGTPASVTATTGNNQSQTINTAFPIALQVLVVDAGGNPVNGVNVVFTAPTTGASATFPSGASKSNSGSVTTDATGHASIIASAGPIAGTYTVGVTGGSPSITTSFTLTNTVGPAYNILITSGNQQNVAINGTYSPLVVNVVDAGGNNVVDGTSVTFTVAGATATATFTGIGTSDTVLTKAGVATSSTLTANALPGTFSVNVASGNATQATFSLTNLAGSAKSITAISGFNQAVTVNKPFPLVFKAQVLDGNSNPVSGATVTFAGPNSGASGTFNGSNVVTTDTNGTATSPVFTANGTAGNYVVSAGIAAGANTFTATFAVANLGVLTVNSVTPSSASESSGSDTAVTISGAGFVASTGYTSSTSATADIVQFVRPNLSTTPLPLTGITIGSTTIGATIPKAYLAIPAGAAALTSPENDTLTVTHPDGTTASVQFTVNPPPTATSVSPTSVNIGTPTVTLTINGNNFNSNASVAITSASVPNGQSLTPAAITANAITLNLTQAFLAAYSPMVAGTASSVPLNVVVSDGGTVSTLTGALTLLLPNIASVNPTSVASGGTAFTLSVNGSNFLSTSSVYWCPSTSSCATNPPTTANGAIALTTAQSASPGTLTATVPAAYIATPGSAFVTVANNPPGTSLTPYLSNQLTFNFGGLQLSSITPTTVQAGAGATPMTLTGLNFQPDATVHFVSGNQDTPLSTTTITINNVVSTTQLSATIPAALITSPGTATISVVNVADATRSNGLTLNIVQSAITSLSQSSAAAGTPGLTLVLNGSNFLTGLNVQWTLGGTATLLNPSQVNPTQVTVAIPTALLATAGVAQIAVMNSGAISSNAVPFTVNNPTITAPLVPASAQLNQATFQMTVTGTNFLNGSVVQWNDGTKTTPLSTTFASSTQLTALVTPSLLATSETVVITVLNPGTGSPAPVSNAVAFAVGPAPTILPVSAGGLSPGSAAAGSPPFVLTVTGTNFTTASVISWDPGAPGTPTKLTTYLADPVNFTMVTATVPASLIGAQGFATITVQNGTVISNPVQFTITAGLSPSISTLTPSSGTAGTTTPVQMTILGNSFESGATVQWNGSGGTQTLTPVFVSSSQLNVNVPVTLLAAAGTASVTVTNPGGGVSNTGTFTINPANQVSITSLQTTTVAAGSGTLIETITGQFFVSGSIAMWNPGTAAVPLATQFVSSTTLTAVIPAADFAAPGVAFISVQNPDKTVSNTELFTITGALPTITSLSQNSAAAGTAGFALTITGTGYTATGTTVMWGSTPLPTLVNSATSLTVNLTNNLLATAGTVNVTVVTAGGTSNAVAFTIGGPTILALSPSSATVGASTLSLSVGGQNFITGATVMWGTTALTTTFVSASQLIATVPATLLATAGAINVTVQNPGGASSTPSPFTVGTGPAAASILPTTVTAGSGAFTLTLTGSNFVTGDLILWQGIPLTTTFVSATQLTGAVPATLTANPDTINIEVLHAGGVLSNLLQLALAGPTQTSVTPTSAPTGTSSVQITVTGTNFVQQSVVSWNATAIPTAFVNSTTLTAQVGSTLLQNPGTAFLTVSNGTGTSGPLTFSILAPSLSSITPGTAVAASVPLSLTISGANFAAGSVVNWNGTPVATNFTSATQLTAVVPVNLASVAGTSIVTVTNPGGSASGIAIFNVTSPPPATVTSFQPTSAIAGSQAFVLTVVGTGFNNSSAAVWNGTSLPTTFVSATQLTAFVNSSLLVLPVQANVTVLNSGATASIPAVFPVNGPTITSLSPSNASAGAPAFNLVVTGANYLPGSLIQWNSVSLPTAFNSATGLTASVPASLVAGAGTASVTVQNPGGATSPALTFTVGPFTLSFTTVSLPDAIVGQIYAAPALQATGGTSPYTWSITGGVIPQGLTLDPNSGTITGTATVPGIASLTIAVTDSVGRTASKTLALHVVLPLTITNTTPLPPATISSAYSQLLIASGGTPPYTWSAGGTLPAGLLLNGNSGQISGTPLVPGLSQFAITATDSRSLAVTSPFSLTTTLQSVTIGGITSSLVPAQQPAITLSLGGPYSVDLSGFLNLAFASAVGADDQSIQFSTGGRQVAFTLPAGTTQPLFGGSSTITISTGTVAGNITVNASVLAGSANVTPTPVPSQTGAVAKAVPVLTSASLTRVTGGINVSITGYSTTRDMTSATVTFNPATGSTITSAPITVQLSSAFTTWYASAASTAVGSSFTITLPFTVNGNTNAIGSATVIMTNSQGASQAITAMPQ